MEIVESVAVAAEIAELIVRQVRSDTCVISARTVSTSTK